MRTAARGDIVAAHALETLRPPRKIVSRTVHGVRVVGMTCTVTLDFGSVDLYLPLRHKRYSFKDVPGQPSTDSAQLCSAPPAGRDSWRSPLQACTPGPTDSGHNRSSRPMSGRRTNANPALTERVRPLAPVPRGLGRARPGGQPAKAWGRTRPRSVFRPVAQRKSARAARMWSLRVRAA